MSSLAIWSAQKVVSTISGGEVMGLTRYGLSVRVAVVVVGLVGSERGGACSITPISTYSNLGDERDRPAIISCVNDPWLSGLLTSW